MQAELVLASFEGAGLDFKLKPPSKTNALHVLGSCTKLGGTVIKYTDVYAWFTGDIEARARGDIC